MTTSSDSPDLAGAGLAGGWLGGSARSWSLTAATKSESTAGVRVGNTWAAGVGTGGVAYIA